MDALRRTGLVVGLGVLLLAGCAPEVPEDQEVETFPVDPDPGADPDIDATDPEGAEPLDPMNDFEGAELTDAELTTRTSPLGEHLVNGHGRTVYLFADDPPGRSTCTDACLETWPIFSTDDVPTVDGSADPQLISMIQRPDGSRQVSYDGQPLYYFIGDESVGDIEGQGVNDGWYIVAPDGRAIVEDANG